MSETSIRLLRHTIDVDGALTPECYKRVFNSKVTEEFFESYDAKENAFEGTAESLIFEAAKRLYERYGNPCTLDTISEEILKQEVGLTAANKKAISDVLNDIKEWDANPNETSYLIDTLTYEWKEARANQILQTTIAHKDKDINKAIKYAINKFTDLQAITANITSNKVESISIKEAIEKLEHDLAQGKVQEYFACHYGINEIDVRLDGVRRKEYILICGPSHVGKSFLVQEFCYRAAFDQGKRVVLASTEMNTEDILDRLMARQTKIPSRKLSRPETLTEEEQERYRICREYFKSPEFEDKFIFVEKGSFSTIEGLKRLITERLGDKQVDLIGLDYIENLTPSFRANGAQWEQMLQVSKEFHHYIEEMNCGGITPAQNNASGMVNGGRDAGVGQMAFKQLYKDADTVMMISEDEAVSYKAPESFDTVGTPGIIYIDIIKGRKTGKGGTKIGLNVEFATASISAVSAFVRTHTVKEKEATKRKAVMRRKHDDVD